jgi:hypothetical protein
MIRAERAGPQGSGFAPHTGEPSQPSRTGSENTFEVGDQKPIAEGRRIMSFSASIHNHFHIHGGRLKFLDPPGTQYLSGRQRFLGMRTGNRLAHDSIFDRINRGASHHAQQRLNNSIQKGWQDGILTRAEANQINDSRRNAGIARQTVNLDNYRKAYGRAFRNAHADGKITPEERSKLLRMRGNYGRMQATLGRMVVQDRVMDRREAFQNRFAGNQVVGFNPQKFIQNFRNKLGIARGGNPSMNQVGQNVTHRCGCGNWQVQPHQTGYPRGSRYLSWAQRARGMRGGAQLARYNPSDAAHRRGHHAARRHTRNTINNAWKDGVLTRSEQNAIRNAQRHEKMAGQHVKIDNYRRAYGRNLRNALRDGVITPQENRSLTNQYNRINRMGGQLNRMQSQDRYMDRREARQNFFHGQQVVGFDLGKFVNHLMTQLGG